MTEPITVAAEAPASAAAAAKAPDRRPTVTATAAPESVGATAAPAAPAPASRVTAVAATTPVENAAAAPDNAPWKQVVEVLRPLRQFADGSHRMSLRLNPEELGAVHVELRVAGDTLSLHLVADTAAARDALRQALPDLRREIAASGFAPGSFDVGERTAREQRDDTTGGSRRPGDPTTSTDSLRVDGISPSASTLRAAASDGRLDIRL